MIEQLKHLPKEKQAELERITQVILKAIQVDRIWLFGSYATGKWVEDVSFENGTGYEYKSDYDILVVVPFDDISKQHKVRKAIKTKLEDKGLLHTPVSLIYHSLKDVNLALLNGSYFFVDIFKEGIELANMSKHELAKPKLLSPTEKQAKAQEHFDQWFESANQFLEVFKVTYIKEYLQTAAFQLHQATERYFHTILLVFTDYKPKQHDLELLESEVIKFDNRLETVFPKDTQEEKRLFSLLRRAYIDSRYRMDQYQITKEELAYLAERVEMLQKLTEEVCRERIRRLTEE
jgi:uncharacterized protein